MGSTHGTILNGGPPIASKAYKRIMAGDSIRFGTSSKLFVLEGGPDREDAQDNSPAAKLVKQANSASDVSSPAPAPQAKSKNSSQDDGSGYVVLTSKRRFGPVGSQKKETDEDLDGEARLEAHLNKKKRSRPTGEDDEDEDVSDEERGNADLEMVMGYMGREAVEGSNDDDSFFDRTLEKRAGPSRPGSKRPETYETTCAKLRVLSFVTDAVKESISQLDHVISKDVNRRNGAGDGDEEDVLDAFMSGMSQTVKEEEERDKKLVVLKELEEEAKDLRKLEQQLKPAAGEISIAVISAAEIDSISDVYYNGLAERVAKSGGSVKLQAKALIPEPKRPKLAEVHQDASHVHSRASEPRYITAEPFERKEIPAPAPKTENAVEFRAPVSLPAASVKEPQPSAPKIKEVPKMSFDEGDGRDSSYVVWQAPVDQSGDGRTSLNDKYGY